MTVKVVNQDTTLKEVIVGESGHFTEHMKPKNGKYDNINIYGIDDDSYQI